MTRTERSNLLAILDSQFTSEHAPAKVTWYENMVAALEAIERNGRPLNLRPTVKHTTRPDGTVVTRVLVNRAGKPFPGWMQTRLRRAADANLCKCTTRLGIVTFTDNDLTEGS
jgi:hypothetical protein